MIGRKGIIEQPKRITGSLVTDISNSKRNDGHPIWSL